MKQLKFLIRYSLLAIIIILGLIVVFPQSLDLKDMILADKFPQQNDSYINSDYQKKSKKSWSFSSLFSSNSAPIRKDVINHLKNMQYVTNVICIGKIPKVTFDEDKARINPPNPTVTFRVITKSMNTPALKTGQLYLKPKIHYVGSGMPMANWFDSNKVEGWNYKARMNREQLLSQTRYTTMNKDRVKKCD